jgi:hypothetical protein
MPESVPATNLPSGLVFPVEPMTLLDLDAAGLDPTQPAPAEFIQFLYDSSRTGYLTLWSSILSQPGGASRVQQWIEAALAVYHARALQTQYAPAGDKPSGSNVTEVTYGGPTTPPAPVCIDVPAVTGDANVGGLLSCTMGNWGNEPTSYAYAWSSGGTDSTYTVLAADAGTSISCIVTATNAGGSTAAPPSNAMTIAGTRATAERSVPRREEPKEETKVEERHTTRSNDDHGRRR